MHWADLPLPPGPPRSPRPAAPAVFRVTDDISRRSLSETRFKCSRARRRNKGGNCGSTCAETGLTCPLERQGHAGIVPGKADQEARSSVGRFSWRPNEGGK